MKKRARAGIGVHTKKAPTISFEDEKLLCDRGIFDLKTGQGILNAIFFKIGIHFALRGGKEHQNLKISNFQLVNTDGAEQLKYTEDISKTNQGGILHRKIQPKEVVVKDDKSCKEPGIVLIFKTYVNACPDPRPEKFYLQPIFNPRSHILFSRQHVGINKLNGMVRKMMNEIR